MRQKQGKDNESMSTENAYMGQPEVPEASAARRSAKLRRLLPGLPSNGALLMAAAVTAIGGGFVLNWGWLVAAGVAPLILSILPCIAMCVLGLCICKLTGKRTADPQPQIDNSMIERATNRTDVNLVGERNTQ
jgi:hypothetical protein